ncbi:MAG: protein kinase [Planctomycetota bacterium]|nr:protein kinase [Planctomycetota bacterium]
MNDAPEPDRSPRSPEEPAPSVLELVAKRLGEAPRISLREEDSAVTASPVIDPSSKDKAAVPLGRSNLQFLGEIARGGMGVILKGHDTDLGRDVAVKVLDKRLADRPEVVQRFVEEAQIGGQLQHPGIVPVYELGTMKDERPFFTMKLVKGRTLATLLSERESAGANRQRLIDIFESICQTMGYAHSRGVIHRDLKPANIMVGAFGEVQVVDWGLAKVLARGGVADEKRARAAHSHLTILETVRSSQGSGSGSDSMVGSVMGTPAYMPPEQASGHVDRLDERSDVFALGAILCEILTGLPPYVGDRDAVIAAAAQAECDGAFARLDASGADPELIKLTKQCLLPAAAARPSNAGVLAERVHAFVVSVEERAHAAQVASAAAQVRAQEERKARKLTLALGAAVVAILLVGGGGWAFVQSERTAREREQVDRLRADAERNAKLSSEVGDALAEASAHQGGARFAEAIQSAERAQALAQGGGASADLLARVDAVLVRLREEHDRAQREAERAAENQKLLAELLEAREPNWDPGRDDPRQAAASYEQVFKNHGIDIDAGTPEEVAAALLKRGLGSEIALFFDSLTEVRRKSRDEAGTARALDVAHAVDPDPLRADLREALAAGALDVLREIADSGFKDQPAITIELLGSAFQQLQERESARRVYRIGIERFPADFSLAYRLGRLLTPPELENGVSVDMQEAVECYRAALALRPDSTVVRYYLGRLYSKLEQYDRSLEQFTIALRQRSDDGTFLFHLGVSRYRLGQPDAALEILRGLADRTEPPWLTAWASSFAGRCLLAKGDVKGATAYFERAVAADPGQSQFYSGLLDAVSASGSANEQQRVVRQYLDRFPNDAGVHNNLAWPLASAPNVEMRNLEEAIRLARRSIELKESDAAWNTLGVALFYKGDLEASIEALRRSVRLQGAGNVVDWLFLAMAHKRLGHASGARDWYDRAVDWMALQSGIDPEVARFRAEADALFVQ